ncbi:MAG: hypothetical protein OXI43_17575 [Candidatus Poribacteria bacterium]|nr:hypothetical protein [Candidatus Poribacteria bacterium]
MSIKTDKAVLTVVFTTFLTFLLLFLLPIRSFGIGAIWWLYPNLLFAIGWFGYLIQLNRNTAKDGSSQLLFHSVLFGSAATATYLPMDWLFSRKLQFIVYTSSDFGINVTTPIGLIMTWVLFGTLAVYCYHRLEMFGLHCFAASGITGIVAAIGSIAIYGLGKELWEWNVLRVDNISHIATVPIFIPITFLLTYTLYPYYFHRKQHALIAGIRCGLFMGIVMFSSFLIFWRL